MRLDLVLKQSRLIKRRTIAKELCDMGKVTINGKVAKPSSEVNEGDILTLTLGIKIINVQITYSYKGIKAIPSYREISKNEA